MKPDPFRRQVKALNLEHLEILDGIKSEAEELLERIDEAQRICISGREAARYSETMRCMQLARTKLEESAMWASKGVSA